MRRRLVRFATPAVVILCATLLAWVQFSFDGMYDGDSYFHTRAARELADHGVRRTFPQTAFSTWSERYSDKDLLFHAILIPFQGGGGGEDLVGAGKRAAVKGHLLACLGAAWVEGSVLAPGGRVGPSVRARVRRSERPRLPRPDGLRFLRNTSRTGGPSRAVMAPNAPAGRARIGGDRCSRNSSGSVRSRPSSFSRSCSI